MKKSRSCLLAAALLLCAVFGCSRAAQNGAASEAQFAAPAQTAESATPEPTAEPTAVPTPEPIDPLAEIDAAEIKAGKHEREEGYRDPFKTHYIDTADVAVHLMDGESYSDEALKTFAKNVVSDILTVRERTGKTTEKVTVFIIQNLLRDRPVTLGDHMICTTEQVESGAYREALCGICCDLKAPWKQAGLQEIVFGMPDDSGLSEYYADESHALTASCAAVYFLPEVAGEETEEAVRKTAVSMTRYLLENGGMEALRETVSTAEILPAWTAQLGIGPITLPTGHERAANMIAYRDRTPRRVCVLQIENITVRVNEGGPAETADELYLFACQMLYGLDLELQMIRDESPIFAETADRRAKETIVITLVDDPTQSGISTGGPNEVFLVNRYAVWHELIHALLLVNGTNTLMWMQEGLAEHFSKSAASTVVAEPESEAFSDWFPEDAGMSEDALAFWTAAYRVYLTVRGEDEAVPAGLYDDWAFRRAVAICELFLPYDPYEGHRYATVNGVRGEKSDAKTTDGNALSYEEAMVVLEYLFDTYGTDTIADCMMNNRTLSETLGKDYPELYQDCIAYLWETYGHLIGTSD